MKIGICDSSMHEVEAVKDFIESRMDLDNVEFELYLPEEASIDVEESTFPVIYLLRRSYLTICTITGSVWPEPSIVLFQIARLYFMQTIFRMAGISMTWSTAIVL